MPLASSRPTAPPMNAPSMCVTAVLRSCHSKTTDSSARPTPNDDVERRIVPERPEHERGIRHCPDKREPREYEPGHI